MRPHINAGRKGKVWKLYSEKLRANEHFSQPWDSAKGRSIHQPTADEGPTSPKKHRAEQTLQCHDLGVWNVTAQKRSWLVFKQPSQYSLACPLHTWQFCKPLPLSWAMNPSAAQAGHMALPSKRHPQILLLPKNCSSKTHRGRTTCYYIKYQLCKRETQAAPL